MFNIVCRVYGCPHMELSAMRADAKLPLRLSPVPDPVAWKQDSSQHLWDSLGIYMFPTFTLLRQVLSRAMLSAKLLMILMAPLATEGVVCRFAASSGGKTCRTPCCGIFSLSLMLGNFTGAWSCFIFMCRYYQVTCPQGRIFKRCCRDHHFEP